MKITFVGFGYENIGVEYLSAFIKKAGHTVSLVLDPALFNTYQIQNNLLRNIFNEEKSLLLKVIASQPELIAFSVLSDNYAWACHIAKKIKKLKPNIPIIFGGIHTTSLPDLVIANNFIDFVCVGEGEEAFLELINALENNKETSTIPNIWSKHSQNSPRNLITDLNQLPLPDKDIFYNEYAGFTGNIYMTMSSRGCPYQCTYCYNSYLMNLYKGKGRYLRQFSVNKYLDELKIAKEKYKMKRILFVDDVFTSNESWLSDFAIKYKQNINKPFGCLVHPLFVNQQIVTFLKMAGCSVVGMGIQTLNMQIKKNIIQREETNQTIRESILLFKKAGILIYVDFIFGIPEESEKDAEDAAIFLSETKPDAVSTLWLRFYPQAEIINIAKNKNFLSETDIDTINQSLISTPISSFGNSNSLINKKLITLVLLSCNLPTKLVTFLIKHNLYKLLPSKNLHHLHTVSKQLFNKLIKRKNGTLYSSLGIILKYYITYIYRFILNKLTLKTDTKTISA